MEGWSLLSLGSDYNGCVVIISNPPLLARYNIMSVRQDGYGWQDLTRQWVGPVPRRLKERSVSTAIDEL